MKRRTFFAALAAIPILGKMLPASAVEPQLLNGTYDYHERSGEPDWCETSYLGDPQQDGDRDRWYCVETTARWRKTPAEHLVEYEFISTRKIPLEVTYRNGIPVFCLGYIDAHKAD